MSRKLDEIRKEREELIRRDIRLRTDLRWQFAHLSVYLAIGERLFSFMARFLLDRRRRRRRS